jgi:hypothetical protein
VTFNRDCTFNRIDRERCLNLARDRSSEIDRYQTHGARREPRLSRLRSRALGARCAALVAAVRLRRSHRVRPWNVRVVSSRLLRVVTRRVVSRRLASSIRRDGDARAVDDVARTANAARRAGCAARQGDVRIARGGSLATSRHGIATAYRSLARASS